MNIVVLISTVPSTEGNFTYLFFFFALILRGAVTVVFISFLLLSHTGCFPLFGYLFFAFFVML